MTKFVLAGHYGPDDRPDARRDEEEVIGLLDLGPSRDKLSFGVGRVIEDVRRQNVLPTEIGVDLATLAVHVHAADTRLSRRVCAQDAWTREIRLSVPVSEPAIWDGAKLTLETMLRFLTGDLWEVGFRNRPESVKSIAPARVSNPDAPHFDGVSLYSGGLDSLIGLIDAVVGDGQWPLFVSHAGEGAVSKPQGELFDQLRDMLAARGGANRQIERIRYAARFPRCIFPSVASENTTRGRSFLFLSLGAMAGSGLPGPFDLRIPENGFIALNVPLDPTRLGSSTTRTTHPFYLHRWNDLLRLIGIQGTVVNPYWNKTKGEMVAKCVSQELLHRFLPASVSCAHPSTSRFAGDRRAHCGVCVPCLIRRAAIEKAWGAGNDPTGYRCEDLTAQQLDSTKAEGQQIRGFEYALSRLAERPGLVRILIHKPGPLLEDIALLDELRGVYTRSMTEVGRLLAGVHTYSSKMPQ